MKLFLLILFAAAVTFGQELNCKVTVNTESIPQHNRELLSDFANIVEDYMNKTRFTGTNWEGGKIDCTLDILILTAPDETNYTAQVFVGSQRPIYKSTKNSSMLRILDNTWSFTYQQNQALYSNQSVYDPIASFLDYYAYLIIGYDLDSWDEFGGTDYFNKALSIVNIGNTSKFSSGWTTSSATYSRKGIVEEILNAKYRPFREGFYNYHYGIDVYGQNKKVGQEKIASLVKALLSLKDKIDVRSVYVRVFFDAKSGEICEYLADYPDKEIFRSLKKVDPQHTAKYDEMLKD